jgi:Predicted hydrolases or acyltransferases (alpha/beta hydrolase superfamily)
MVKITKPGIFLLIFFFSIKIYAQNSSEDYVVTNDKVKLYTKKSGAGPVCIFIHGGPGAWSKSFEDLGGKNLESHLTMIYYDQRGSGRSEDAKDDNYSLDRMLKDIEEIRIKYNADRVYLLSHSFGGILATNYALKYSSNVKGIILANSTLHIEHSILNQISYMNKLLETKFKASDSTLLSSFMQARTELDKRKLVYKLLSDNKENIALLDSIDNKNPSNFSFAQKAFGIKDYMKDFTSMTSLINVPVLVITGKKDHAIGEKHYKKFKFPNQSIAKINGGHILYYERNEKFISSILRFVNRVN